MGKGLAAWAGAKGGGDDKHPRDANGRFGSGDGGESGWKGGEKTVPEARVKLKEDPAYPARVTVSDQRTGEHVGTVEPERDEDNNNLGPAFKPARGTERELGDADVAAVLKAYKARK